MPEDQRALHNNLAQAVQAEGNAVCGQLEATENGLHDRMDDMGARLERLLEYHEREPPPAPPDDLQLMARLSQKRILVRSMDALLAEHSGARPPRGLTKGEKAAQLVQQLPREKVRRLLVAADEPGQRASKRAKSVPPAQGSPPHTQTTLTSMFTAARSSGADSGADSAASTTAPVSPSSAPSLPAEEAREGSHDSLVWF